MLFFRATSFGKVALEVLRLKELRSPKTKENAELQIRRLVNHFGKIPPRKITEDVWTDYVISQQKQKARKFFDDRKYMRNILLYAKRKGLVDEIPPLPIPDPPWDAGREITTMELERLEAAAGAELRFQIRIARKMGLRLREMLRLEWSQFHWDAAVIYFEARRTKTRKAREVAIPLDLVLEFRRRHKEATTPFVFPAPNGKQAQDCNKTAWRRCRNQANVKARWHDLRHTCATVMLRRGVEPHIVRAYLGMSEVVLMRIYVHLNREDLHKAAAAMSEEPKANTGR